MFEMKADPKLPHHYIIGVSMYDMRSSPKRRGKMFLKYGPVYFHHKDIENVQDAAMMSVDKVFKTTPKEASDMFDCRNLVVAINGLKLAASANNSSLHHFSSAFKISDASDWFNGYVNNANIAESIRKQLDDARMPGY
jgi:hypothetical protein